MDFLTRRLTLHPFTVDEARRVCECCPGDGDQWAEDYPLVDELDPLRNFVKTYHNSDHEPFTLYQIRENITGKAIGGAGFFGPPDADGVVTLGYGLVSSARRRGYATEAVFGMLDIARASGALAVAADTSVGNEESIHVLQKTGFAEVDRTEADVFFRVVISSQRD